MLRSWSAVLLQVSILWTDGRITIHTSGHSTRILMWWHEDIDNAAAADHTVRTHRILKINGIRTHAADIVKTELIFK